MSTASPINMMTLYFASFNSMAAMAGSFSVSGAPCLHATALHLLGIDRKRLTFYHNGIEDGSPACTNTQSET